MYERIKMHEFTSSSTLHSDSEQELHVETLSCQLICRVDTSRIV
jgi:hypothetical protein